MTEPPPILRRAQNAAKALARNAAHLVNGGELMVDEETKAARLAICGNCQLFNHSVKICTHQDCGCYMKAKTWLTAEKCPDGKW